MLGDLGILHVTVAPAANFAGLGDLGIPAQQCVCFCAWEASRPDVACHGGGADVAASWGVVVWVLACCAVFLGRGGRGLAVIVHPSMPALGSRTVTNILNEREAHLSLRFCPIRVGNHPRASVAGWVAAKHQATCRALP